MGQSPFSLMMCDFCIICAATQGDFASADATRGQQKQTNVCDRPLDPFGCTLLFLGFCRKFLFWLLFYRPIMQKRPTRQSNAALSLNKHERRGESRGG